METVGPNALTVAEFTRAWDAPFEVVVKDAVINDRLRGRRLVLEGRVAQAALDTVRWTRWAVVLALATSTLSLAVGVAGLIWGE